MITIKMDDGCTYKIDMNPADGRKMIINGAARMCASIEKKLDEEYCLIQHDIQRLNDLYDVLQDVMFNVGLRHDKGTYAVNGKRFSGYILTDRKERID
nr:MAG TPA: hypothetical protein [Caudoviricetes sp.]